MPWALQLCLPLRNSETCKSAAALDDTGARVGSTAVTSQMECVQKGVDDGRFCVSRCAPSLGRAGGTIRACVCRELWTLPAIDALPAVSDVHWHRRGPASPTRHVDGVDELPRDVHRKWPAWATVPSRRSLGSALTC
jgi:hypothetical protein